MPGPPSSTRRRQVPSRWHSTSADDLIERMRAAVVDGPGELDRSVRRAAFGGGDALPTETATYVEKVRHNAYKVTDGDVAALKAAGWSDDALFELTVATALGAALSRREIAKKAMGR